MRNPLLFTLLLLSLTSAQAAEILLYDGTQNARPQDQAWMTYIPNPFVTPAPVQNVVAGTGVELDTTNNTNHSAGYFNYDYLLFSWALKNPSFPDLDPDDGFKLAFDLQIDDEDHLSNNRAGFSVILLGMDLFGIELGFWEDKIWAQSGPSFTQDEGATFSTLDWITYELLILNSEYILFADGLELLSGATRDYSPATPIPDPYDVPNMLFLGDNTTSASADFTLGSIRLTTGPFDQPSPMPAAPTFVLMLGGMAWFARVRTRA